MEKKPFYWVTMPYAGTFNELKIKSDYAEEVNLHDGLYFAEDEFEEAVHLKRLIQVLIKANYQRARDWYQDLPPEYLKLLEQLKIDRNND